MPDQSYYYDRAGKPITAEQYMELYEAALDSQEAWERQRLVAREELDDGVVVSTVWTGMNTGLDEPPRFFETMAFGGPEHHITRRYSSEGAALAGHREIVERLRDRASQTQNTTQEEGGIDA